MRSGGIFEVQPDWCRQTLPLKDIEWTGKRIDHNKVAFYDPTELYKRIADHIDPFKRNQSIGMQVMWPNEKGICACGCESKLTGRQTRWVSGHDGVATNIYNIIYGATNIIYFYLKNYYGDACANCGRSNDEVFNEDIRHLPSWNYVTNLAPLKVDHIFPVKFGGGGGWLSNYQLLCHKCHVSKTNEDFGWKQPKKSAQTSLF